MDGRGRHTNEKRAERLAFVGAVVAQLIESGTATHHGLKTCAMRIPTARESELKLELSLYAPLGSLTTKQRETVEGLLAELNDESVKATISGDIATSWKRPPDDVWVDIQACPHNPDCVALVVAYTMAELGYRYSVRHKNLRGTFHSDFTPKRSRSTLEELGDSDSTKTPWRMIEGMTRGTSSYWGTSARNPTLKQKTALVTAGKWFFELLKKHDAINILPSSASGMLRDDIADFLAGKPVKPPKTGLSVPAPPTRRS